MFNLNNEQIVFFLIPYLFVTYFGAVLYLLRKWLVDIKQRPFSSKKATIQYITIMLLLSLVLALLAPLLFPVWLPFKLPGLKDRIIEGIKLKKEFRENVSFLKHPEVSVRRKGVSYLGKSKYPKAAKYLLESLKDDEPLVRLEAARCLEDLKISFPLEPLEEILKDDDKSIRSSAASILKEQNWVPENEDLKLRYYIGVMDVKKLVELGEKAIPSLVEIINGEKSTSYSVFTAQKAIEALDRLNWKPTSEKSRLNYSLLKMDVEELLSMGEPVVKKVINSMDSGIGNYVRAMDFLSRIGTEEACRKIMNDIESAKSPVFSNSRYHPARVKCIQALGEKGGPHLIHSLSKRILPEEPAEFLSALVTAISRIIETNGLESLETILPGDKDSWKNNTGLRMFWTKELAGLLDSTSKYHYEVAVLCEKGWWFADKTGECPRDFWFKDCAGSYIQAIANIGTDVVKPLVRRAEDRTLPLLARTVAASALACIKKDSIESLSSETSGMLSEFDAGDIEKAHLEVLSSESSEIGEKKNAVKALGNLRSLAAVGELTDILKQNKNGDKSSAMFRASAVEALGKIGDKRAVPTIIEVLLNQEKLVTSRYGAFYNPMEEKTEYRTILWSIDANYPLRFHAALALGNFGGEDVINALQTCLEKEKRNDVKNQAKKSILKIQQDQS